MIKKTYTKYIIGFASLIIIGIGITLLTLNGGMNNIDETVVVGTSPDYPPLEYKEQGKLSGFDIDVMEEIAKIEKIKFRWEEMKFDKLIKSIEDKKISIIASGMRETPERKKYLLYTEKYLCDTSAIITKDSKIKNVLELKDKLVWVEKGTIMENHLIKNNFKNIRTFEDAGFAIEQLLKDKAEGVYAGFHVGNFLSKNIQGVFVAPEKITENDWFGLAVSKDKPELFKKINSGIKKLKENGKLKELSEKWLGFNIYDKL